MSAIADDDTIGVYDLKAHLSSVLEEVISGRVVTVTRHGHAIARIHPAVTSTLEERRAAIERMKRARTGRKLGMSAKAAIAEGRQ
jgi:prevent-host-death family protein